MTKKKKEKKKKESLERNRRICRICGMNCIEDEVHSLIKCPLFKKGRKDDFFRTLLGKYKIFILCKIKKKNYMDYEQ